jgi:hypothetical protein
MRLGVALKVPVRTVRLRMSPVHAMPVRPSRPSPVTPTGHGMRCVASQADGRPDRAVLALRASVRASARCQCAPRWQTGLLRTPARPP